MPRLSFDRPGAGEKNPDVGPKGDREGPRLGVLQRTDGAWLRPRRRRMPWNGALRAGGGRSRRCPGGWADPPAPRRARIALDVYVDKEGDDKRF